MCGGLNENDPIFECLVPSGGGGGRLGRIKRCGLFEGLSLGSSLQT